LSGLQNVLKGAPGTGQRCIQLRFGYDGLIQLAHELAPPESPSLAVAEQKACAAIGRHAKHLRDPPGEKSGAEPRSLHDVQGPHRLRAALDPDCTGSGPPIGATAKVAEIAVKTSDIPLQALKKAVVQKWPDCRSNRSVTFLHAPQVAKIAVQAFKTGPAEQVIDLGVQVSAAIAQHDSRHPLVFW